MNITKEQAGKLGKYFINADPFLWGVLQAKNKKGRLKELKQMGFLAIYSEGSNPIYSKINRDLLHIPDQIGRHSGEIGRLLGLNRPPSRSKPATPG